MINGLILEGARRHVTTGCIVESIPNELFPTMPVMRLALVIVGRICRVNVMRTPKSVNIESCAFEFPVGKCVKCEQTDNRLERKQQK